MKRSAAGGRALVASERGHIKGDLLSLEKSVALEAGTGLDSQGFMPFEWHHLVLLIAFAYFFLMGYSLGRQVTDTDPTSIRSLKEFIFPGR